MNPRTLAPPRHRRRLARIAALGGVAVLAVAACGSPPPATSAPVATETPLPAATFTGGSAAATLDAPETATWRGGWCTRAEADAWLAVNIGDLNGEEYFGLVVGADPHADAVASLAAGGGTFRGGAATITWRHRGARFVAVGADTVVVLAPDLHSGSFGGTLADGREVRGTFDCP